MAERLSGKRVAILVTDGFEQIEMTEPRAALQAEGAETVLIAPRQGRVKGWNHTDWGDEFDVELPLAQARAEDFDALLLPGGVMNPDRLRMQSEAVALAQAFVDAGKPVAAICHGPWLLVEADVVNDRTVTSWPSLRTDLENAGARWVDQEVVVDQGLVTSRNPGDIPAFNRQMIEVFAAGRYQPPSQQTRPGAGARTH